MPARLPASTLPRRPAAACSQALLASPQALRALAVYHVLPEAIRWAAGGMCMTHVERRSRDAKAAAAGRSRAVPARIPAPALPLLAPTGPHRCPTASSCRPWPVMYTRVRVLPLQRGCLLALLHCAPELCMAAAHALLRPRAPGVPSSQGQTLSLTVRRGGGGVSFEGVGSTARLLIPDVPVCEASACTGTTHV